MDEDTAIKRIEYENKELTRVKIYVDLENYKVVKDDSENLKNRVIAKVYIPTYMGNYQMYNGVKPDEWKVHVTLYDNDTGDVIEEYDYPMVNFPKILI